MKTEEAIIDGKKVNIVVKIDDDLVDEVLLNQEFDLEDTVDLSKTIEFLRDDLSE